MPLRTSTSLALSLLALAVAACATSTPADDAGSDGGVDLCGTMPPADGASCTREGLVCEYGEDPRRECRTTATCSGGHFALAVAGCPPPPVDTCPTTREAAAGTTCAVADAYCVYGELACHCTDCPRGAPLCGPATMLRWDCDVPNVDPQCPTAMPPRGAPCAVEGHRCVYACGDDNARTCTAGVWVGGPGDSCPISTRRLKRDITYLAPGDVDALAARASRIPLATYEYTEPALGEGRRLGFVIEDQPDPSFAVEPSRVRVDLYGYTSLVLAATQSQERRIAALERDVESLRAGAMQPAAALSCEVAR